METKDSRNLDVFRQEYEQSGLSIADFARSKDMDYWKVNYALRKALNNRKKEDKGNVGFKKLVPKPIQGTSAELRIRTSYGSEIIIPL